MPFNLSEKEAKAKCIEALRSGQYQQCLSALCNGYGHCCLGVFCEVFMIHEDGIITKSVQESGYYRFNHDQCSLPNVVKDWLGLKSVSGDHQINGRDSKYNLYRLNDDLYWSFAEIADILEQRHNDYFTWSM